MAHSLAPKHGGSGETVAEDGRGRWNCRRTGRRITGTTLHRSARWRKPSRTRDCRARLIKTTVEYEDLKTELAGEGGWHVRRGAVPHPVSAHSRAQAFDFVPVYGPTPQRKTAR